MKMGPHAFSTRRLGTAFRAHAKPLTRDILGFAIENDHMKKKIHFPSFHFQLHGHRKGGGGGGGRIQASLGSRTQPRGRNTRKNTETESSPSGSGDHRQIIIH